MLQHDLPNAVDLPVCFEDILGAAERIKGQVEHTPTVQARAISERIGVALFLKLETFQRTGSFKERGATNKLLQLSAAEHAAGVISVSAGNHAQGVASQCARLGIAATIVMPATTPLAKIRRTEAFGARVVLAGDTVASSFELARQIIAREGLTMVHPFDDPAVIAGQGTVALEMLADVPDLDALVVPIGGGGLISGIAVAARRLRPNLEIIGVQTERYPSYYQIRHGGEQRDSGQTIAEGIAVEHVGKLTQLISDRLVDDVLLVGEAGVERAIFALLDEQKLVTEGAGAVGLAAVLAHPARFVGRRVGLVISGGNIDSGLLANCIMRSHVRSGRVVRMRVELYDKPGALALVSRIIGDFGANILDVTFHRLFSDVASKYVDLDITVELRASEDAARIIECLAQADFPTRVLAPTANEQAGGSVSG
ncbi:MAG TPA: threonine ammonia-lyase [Candidatus Baltobacteraceae bacterium]|jgi:threonine dehydratase|nr:threonine ammonia-lyase [Candidatus Baltobacteraceae bacterium]